MKEAPVLLVLPTFEITNRFMKDILILLVLPIALFASAFAAEIDESVLFRSGEEGYSNYRIPSLITTKGGAVLAFCEARKENRNDSGNIDLVVKRSEDSGKTWSALSVVWDAGDDTAGNPCPVVDQRTGRIVMLMCWNLGTDHGKALHAGTAKGTRLVYQTQSDDDGLTWSPAKEITSSVKDSSWWWFATGPGIGIQLKKGSHKGRLVIPANHTAPGYYGAHALFSDDGGNSWSVSSLIRPTVNESQVVELSDGRLMMNMRTQGTRETKRPYDGYRSIAISSDGGETWSNPVSDDELGDPICQASIIRYDDKRILFSNPRPPVSLKRGPRERMTIRLSHDNGTTWPSELLVTEAASAYSSLARLPDDRVGLLYEKNKDITFARISIESIR
jgi:sialidase-1